jgi:hypothetical protein
MFSSSKILFANYVNRELPPPVLPTTTTTSAPVPLRITAQPQNVTLSAGSTASIGQTTWATGSGYKRTMVRWERSLDGVNWYQETSYNSNYQSGEFSIPMGANRAQSGLKYRAYAYAYEEYTRLGNYMGQSYETLDGFQGGGLGNQGGSLRIISSNYSEDFAFIFLKGGQFRTDIRFVGAKADAGRRNLSDSLRATIGNRNVASLRNIPAYADQFGFYAAENAVFNVDFTASPGELMAFYLGPTANFPGLQYQFSIVSLADVPYAGQKVVSEPFTLTVT